MFVCPDCLFVLTLFSCILRTFHSVTIAHVVETVPSIQILLFHEESCNFVILQALWCDEDSSLWMLPCMTDDLVSTLNQRGILNILQLLDVPLDSLQFLSKSSTASRLHEVCYLSH